MADFPGTVNATALIHSCPSMYCCLSGSVALLYDPVLVREARWTRIPSVAEDHSEIGGQATGIWTGWPLSGLGALRPFLSLTFKTVILS